MSNEESAEQCGECQGDDLEVTGFREIRQPSRLGGPDVVIARRTDYRCRDCGCDGFITRRIQPNPSKGPDTKIRDRLP